MLHYFLLPLILILPFATCLLPKIKSQAVGYGLCQLLPVLFLILLTGLLRFDVQARQLVFFASTGVFSFGFIIDDFAARTLYLLGFLWLTLTFYACGYFRYSHHEQPQFFMMVMSCIFAFLHAIIVAKNLITVLFFANLLLLTTHIFATTFIYHKEAKMTQILTYLVYAQSILLFFATIATYKFSGIVDFNYVSSALNEVSNSHKISILGLYLGALFLPFVIPVYVIDRTITLDSFRLYVFFILGLAIFALYLFIKVIISFFTMSQFLILIGHIGLFSFELILLFLLVFLAIFIFLSQKFTESVFFLIFSQMLFAIFSTLLFVTHHQDKLFLPLLSFILSQTLFILTCSNLSIYLSSSQNSDSKGLFFDLKVTIVLMFFAFLNLCGIIPGLGMYERFFIIKTIVTQGLFVSGLIFMLNLIILALFAIKFFIPLLQPSPTKPTKGDSELANVIDQDSHLMLTTLMLALVILLLPIIFWFNTNLLSL